MLIVEDNTGVTGANSYLSLSDFQQFADEEGFPYPTYTPAQQGSALVIASRRYVDSFSFAGAPVNADQGLKLPTDKVTLNRDIKYAVYLAACLHLQGRLFVAPTDIQARAVTGESKAVGSLSKSTQYAQSMTYTNKYPTTAIDALVAKHATVNAGFVALRG